MMSEIEIRARFRSLSPYQDRVAILAQLNAVDRKRIVDILGVDVKKKSHEKIVRKKGKPYADKNLLMSLYLEGLSDTEIGSIVGIHQASVWKWRYRHKLPNNRSKKEE